MQEIFDFFPKNISDILKNNNDSLNNLEEIRIRIRKTNYSKIF